MAKHRPKKKKSPKTPESDDSTKNDDAPPTEPVVTEDEKDRNKRQLDLLFWLRVVLAIVAGTAATFLFESIEGEERRWASIGFLIIVFIASIIIAKALGVKLPPSDKKKIVTQGIGSYIFLYLFMWILTYTMVHLPGSESGLPVPFP